MKTFSTRPADVRREWRVIDASGQSLGRLSTQIAIYLRGKHKPIYTPHLDVGDFVIVINAAKVRLTGQKLDQKQYYHHSGYPGGLKVRSLKHEMEVRPERVIERAVRGMLPKGPLGLHLFNHLKVYAGETHPHEAQVRSPISTWTAPAPASNEARAPRSIPSAAAGIAPVGNQLPAAETPPELPAPSAAMELQAPEIGGEMPAPTPEESGRPDAMKEEE